MTPDPDDGPEEVAGRGAPGRLGGGRLRQAAAELADLLARGEGGTVKACFVIQEIADTATAIACLPRDLTLPALRHWPLRDQAAVPGHLCPRRAVALTDATGRGALAGIVAG